MRLLTRHPLITFGWMLLSAMVFGLCSYNLFSLLKADIDLIVDYGVMALMDGALKQLVMLGIYGIISLCAYLIFKACEHILVDRLIKPAAPKRNRANNHHASKRLPIQAPSAAKSSVGR